MEGTDDFHPPEPYYSNTDQVGDLDPSSNEADKVTFSAWVQNLQAHPLGTALHVRALFVIDYERPLPNEEIDVGGALREFTIAYVEHMKPVAIGLFKIPRTWKATVRLFALTYFDFYRERHEHSDPGQSNTPQYGRLECIYDNEMFISVPLGRPERD